MKWITKRTVGDINFGSVCRIKLDTNDYHYFLYLCTGKYINLNTEHKYPVNICLPEGTIEVADINPKGNLTSVLQFIQTKLDGVDT